MRIASPADWIFLLAGLFLLIEAVRGLITGSTILFYRTVTRSGDGCLYWVSIGAGAVLGVAGLLVFSLKLLR
jgi:hypothetical protein